MSLTPSQEAASCRPCRNASRHGTCLEPQAAGLAERFVIVWAPAGYAKTCKAFDRKGDK
jgi:hypothetical protein